MVATKKSQNVRRKLIAFDAETWAALELLRRDRLATFDELADEAFRDLLTKHGRPTELRAALRQSVRESAPAQERGEGSPRRSAPRRRRKEAAP
jgi:hypothetical protein